MQVQINKLFVEGVLFCLDGFFFFFFVEDYIKGPWNGFNSHYCSLCELDDCIWTSSI